MSIIRTQASNQVLINYIGTLISAVATIIVFPLALDAYGLAQFLLNTAMLMVPFVTFGTITAIVKFYPEQKNEAFRKSYLLNMALIHAVGLVFFFVLFFIFRNAFYDVLSLLHFDALKVKRYSLHLMAASLFVVINRVMTLHASNYKKIAVPAIYNMLLPKISLPVLVLLRYYEVIGEYIFLWLWVATFFISSVGLTIYLQHIGGLDIRRNFKVLTRRFIGRVATYSGFTGLGAMATMLANRVDVIMVALLLGNKEAGVYAIALFIANVLAIPTNAIWQIASPVIAGAWERNELEKIRTLYQRTSINLLLFGILMYFLALGSLDSIFSLTARYEDLVVAIMVFAFLGVAKIIDMMMGIDYQIIIYSRFYKYNLIFVLILGIGNVILNYYFIQEYGVTGAAIATGISVAMYHLMKVLFIWLVFRMQPFTKDTLKAIAIAGLALAVYLLSPDFGHPVVHILLYCSILSIVFFTALRIFKVETDVIPFMLDRLRSALQSLKRD